GRPGTSHHRAIYGPAILGDAIGRRDSGGGPRTHPEAIGSGKNGASIGPRVAAEPAALSSFARPRGRSTACPTARPAPRPTALPSARGQHPPKRPRCPGASPIADRGHRGGDGPTPAQGRAAPATYRAGGRG